MKALGSCAYALGTIGDIVDQIQDGLHGVRHYVPVGIPLLGVGNVTPDGIDLTNANHITAEEHECLKASHVRKGDLLVTITGRLGTASLYESDQPANLSAHVALCRMKTGHEPLFLKYFLASRFGEASLTKAQIGSTHPHINVRRLKELPLPVPPLNIQKKLVDEMEMAAESRRKKLQQADELLDSLDEWLMVKLGLTAALADKRTIFAVRLDQLKAHRIDVPAYRPFFARGHQPKTPLTSLSKLADIDAHRMIKPEDENELVPYVGLPECGQTEVREVRMRPYHEVKGRSIVNPGDILFARIEPSVFNKKYVLVEDLKGYKYSYTSTEFYVVTPNQDVVAPHYLYAMFFCSFVFNQVQGKTTGSSGRRRLDPGLFESLQIPKPAMKAQQSIADEVRRRREDARRLRAEAEAEWAAAKERFEEQLLGGQTKEAVAINADKWQNKDKEESHDKGRNKKGSAKAGRVAKKPRGYKRAEEGLPGEDSGLGGKVHGIREGAGEYDPAEGTPRKGEDSTLPVDSTRHFETAQGTKTYSEVAEIIAVSVARTIESIVEQAPADIHITPEWICKIHRDIAAELFPDWAGQFRTVNVKVGPHSPPSFYEVPIHMRLYCEDLTARLSSGYGGKNIGKLAETLAFADWRFQWIHPFKDFNGRVGRIILAAVLFILILPPADTAAVEPKEKERYLKALRAADNGDMTALTGIWVERLSTAMREK